MRGSIVRIPAPFALLILCASACIALNPQTSLYEYHHDVIQEDNGLSQSSVTALAQDSDGYLWLGFAAGLARYDGISFTIFDRHSNGEIRSDSIQALRAVRDGSLWIGTRSGVIHRKEGAFRAYGIAEGLAGENVTSIAEGADGSVWIGTEAGLNRFHNEKFTLQAITAKDGVKQMIAGRDGSIWIATSRGLERIKADGSAEKVLPDVLKDPVNTIAEDPRTGNLWVGTTETIYRITGNEASRFGKDNGAPESPVKTMIVDSSGTLWAGTAESGLYRYRDGVFEKYNSKNELYNSSIAALLEDREGSLWTGGNSGLNSLRNTRAGVYNDEDGLPDALTSAVLADSNDNVWIGTKKGLAFLSKQDRHLRIDPRIPTGDVRVLMEDSRGAIWVGTENNGAYRLNPDGLRKTEILRTAAPIHSMAEDKNGNEWIGGADGSLMRVSNSAAPTHIPTGDLWGSRDVVDLACDAAGSLWVATAGSGLWRFDGKQWNSFHVKDGLRSEFISALYFDAAGVLWIGTNGGGLARRQDGRFAAFGAAEGLCDDHVNQIVADRAGNLWIGSPNGIFRVSLQDFQDVSSGSKRTVNCNSMSAADGLESRETGAGNPATRTSDGRVWFPTINGAAAINPEALINKVPPGIVLQEVTAGDLRFYTFRNLIFDADARTLEFGFTGLSFIHSHSIQYRYKLEGYDSGWNKVRDRRFASYNNLPPGRYTFRVMASNSDGVWNRKSASAAFEISPAATQTWWFRALVAGAVLFTLLFLHRLMTGRLRKRKQELEILLQQKEKELRSINRELAGKRDESAAFAEQKNKT